MEKNYIQKLLYSNGYAQTNLKNEIKEIYRDGENKCCKFLKNCVNAHYIFLINVETEICKVFFLALILYGFYMTK